MSRDTFVSALVNMKKKFNLSQALFALYEQQLACGFILSNPAEDKRIREKFFYDKKSGVTFCLSWNPSRQLRKKHTLLVKRGILVRANGTQKLVNFDESGRACYLCPSNIAIQNPSEVLLPVMLGRKKYFIAANFSPITVNHFVVINRYHKKQAYSGKTIKTMYDLILKTKGDFRIIFNGIAGASIEAHEHFQMTTRAFPIESIRLSARDIFLQTSDFTAWMPSYYTPLWIVEGPLKNPKKTLEWAHQVIAAWESIDLERHSVNLIACQAGSLFRLFIFPRDTRRLMGPGKTSPMGSFECGGFFVLSADVKTSKNSGEKEFFQHAGLPEIRKMLSALKPVAGIKSIFDFIHL